jgi:hypothetical protein
MIIFVLWFLVSAITFVLLINQTRNKQSISIADMVLMLVFAILFPCGLVCLVKWDTVVFSQKNSESPKIDTNFLGW